MRRFILIFAILFLGARELIAQAGSERVAAPQPFGPTPSERQLAWHNLEFYGLIHFGINTFTDLEWGYGDAPASSFNPSSFDARQIVSAMKDAGMQGVVLVCKHHDGFCLWRTQTTDYSITNSPWRDGKGDLVREISDACRNLGLKFGVYLSPWDRHRADYGLPEYIGVYRKQLSELLTNYGELFTVWFDGAQGGAGYYGGQRGERKVDQRLYYDWTNTWNVVRTLQPKAAIFSDAGPDVRWVGNEEGSGSDPSWCTINASELYPGFSNYKILGQGVRTGAQWIPPECDASLRMGWFYHEKEDLLVKSPKTLVDTYFRSVGRGASLNLNVSPDKRGLLGDRDVNSLREIGARLKQIFTTNLAQSAKISASNVRCQDDRFGPKNLLDSDRSTYWATDDNVRTAEIILDFGKPISFNVVRLREYLPLGQRIEGFFVDTFENGAWKECFLGTSIGNQRLLRSKSPIQTSRLRVRITNTAACPALSELGIYSEFASSPESKN